jgi:AbiV family abortive infection protein
LALTNEECFEGVEKSFENALIFIDDARLLLKQGSYGHSVALSLLAMEECGKTLFLAAMHERRTGVDPELFDVIFTKHVPKLYLPLLELALSEHFSNDDIDYVQTLAPTLDKVKQRGFYVDYINGRWVTPQDAGLEEIARINLEYAEKMYTSIAAYVKPKGESLELSHSK